MSVNPQLPIQCGTTHLKSTTQMLYTKWPNGVCLSCQQARQALVCPLDQCWPNVVYTQPASTTDSALWLCQSPWSGVSLLLWPSQIYTTSPFSQPQTGQPRTPFRGWVVVWSEQVGPRNTVICVPVWKTTGNGSLSAMGLSWLIRGSPYRAVPFAYFSTGICPHNAPASAVMNNIYIHTPSLPPVPYTTSHLSVVGLMQESVQLLIVGMGTHTAVMLLG